MLTLTRQSTPRTKHRIRQLNEARQQAPRSHWSDELVRSQSEDQDDCWVNPPSIVQYIEGKDSVQACLPTLHVMLKSMTRNQKHKPRSDHNSRNHNNKDRSKVTRNSQQQATEDPFLNKPKNYFIRDATVPYEFSFYRYGSKSTVLVHQTPAEELWPGGALWDLGVLLSRVLVELTRGASNHSSSNSDGIDHLLQAIPCVAWKNTTVLELGCGVGLTGLVAAALGARTVALTDLEHVVQGITWHNIKLNHQSSSKSSSNLLAKTRTAGSVAALPLCWGNHDDEQAVLDFLKRNNKNNNSSNRRKKETNTDSSSQHVQDPRVDLILIGDVAYQHKPGAPSHFDALISTCLKFVSQQRTLVVFGTRMRMPASADLLDMFRQHLREVLVLEAHHVDASLDPNQHNMTIHFFRKI